MSDLTRPARASRPTLRLVALVVVASLLVTGWLVDARLARRSPRPHATVSLRTVPATAPRAVHSSPATVAAARSATAAAIATSRGPHGTIVAVPTSYRASLDSLYRTMYNAAAVMPSTSTNVATLTPARFDATVASMSPANLSYVYVGSRRGASFSAAESSVTAFVPVERALVRTMDVHAAATSAPSTTSVRATSNPKSSAPHDSGLSSAPLTQIPDGIPQSGSFGGGVGDNPFVMACPSDWATSIDPYSQNAIFALQVVLDVANGAYNATSVFDEAFVASVILSVIILIAQEVQNDGAYLLARYGDCEANNSQNAGLDIDNSTYQTYELLASVAATANTADQNLATLINQNAANYELQLQGVIEQALTQPVSDAPMVSLELPAAQGGYLDSTPVGVQEVVTSEIQSLQSAGQLSSPVAQRDLGLAGQAYGAGNDKLAFQYYELAYQAASQ